MASKYTDPDRPLQEDPYADPSTYGNNNAICGIPLYPDEAPGNPKLNRFVVNGWKDKWAAVLFLLCVFMTLIWGAINFGTYKLVTNGESNSTTTAESHSTKHFQGDETPMQKVVREYSVGGTVGLLIAVFVISALVATAGLFLMSMFPRQFILVANIITVLLFCVAAVLSFVNHVIFAGIMLLIVAALHAVWLFFARHRIPFAAELLKAACGVVRQYHAIIVVNFGLGATSVVYMIFWGSMMLPPVDRLSANQGRGADGFLVALFMLIFFWVGQVIPNMMHVTTAGVVSTWYFAGDGRMPHNPTVASLKRTCTTSFGSICFGSLIVAVIRFIRWLAESNSQHENSFVRCIFLCIISCLERLMEYLNHYAFVHVAIYGCGYIEAAKRTWELTKQCAFAALFNDQLIGPTLALLQLGMSGLIGAVFGLAFHSALFGGIAFFLSLLVHSLFFSAVDSAIVTIFVCFAEVPEALRQSMPDLYATIQSADRNGTNNNAAP